MWPRLVFRVSRQPKAFLCDKKKKRSVSDPHLDAATGILDDNGNSATVDCQRVPTKIGASSATSPKQSQ